MKSKAKELLEQKKSSVYISVARDEREKATELQNKLTAAGFMVINPFVIENLQLFSNPTPTMGEKIAYKLPQLLRCDFVVLSNNWIGYEECQLEAMAAKTCKIPVYGENLQEIPVVDTLGIHITTK